MSAQQDYPGMQASGPEEITRQEEWMEGPFLLDLCFGTQHAGLLRPCLANISKGCWWTAG